MLVRSAFRHEGPARLLVHRLKYEAVVGPAGLLAGAMVEFLPRDAAAIVPVPRAPARRWRYGVDPAFELASSLAARTGVPVLAALRGDWWHRRRAGGRDAPRGSPRFRATASVPAGAVLIDDVITTGTTLQAAGGALPGIRLALTATTAGPRGQGAARYSGS
jgi:predicted amidophosphoribosyltransferase